MFLRSRLTAFSLLLVLTALTVDASAQQGLLAEYFNDIELRDFVLKRVEQKPYLNNRLLSPAPGVNKEYFSVRWTGSITAPVSGHYTFHVRSDDGVRVWVNEQKIVDEWHDQEANDNKARIFLQAGKKYSVKIEYFNSIIHSVFSFSWEKPDSEFQFLGITLFSRESEIPVDAFSQSQESKIIKQEITLEKSDERAQISPQTEQTEIPVKKTMRQIPPKSPLVLNQPFVLKSVHFEQTKSQLLPEAFKELDTIVDHLSKNSQIKIQIIGHTDYAGDSTDNYVLSQHRADAVANYIKSKGIAENRVVALAMGSTQPLVRHEKISDRKQNRRVEFVLVE